MLKWFAKLQRFIGDWWYVPLIALLAAVDAFILIVPIEMLLIVRVLARRRGWWWAALLVAFGSAMGALALADLVHRHDSTILSQHWLDRIRQSRDWSRAEGVVHAYGILGITLISLSPIPQHPAIIMGALANLPLGEIFVAIFVARAIKYLVYAALAAYTPGWLMKIPLIRKHIQAFRHAGGPK